MIKSFKCKETEKIFNRKFVKKFSGVERQCVKKLDRLDASPDLEALAGFSGNHFEKLKGNLKGKYSIRVNDQWRICFKWNEGAEDVEIIDYH